MCLVPVLAPVIAWWPGSDVPPGLVTRLGAGLLLLISGARALSRALRTPVPV